jgi:hypothetical protein
VSHLLVTAAADGANATDVPAAITSDAMTTPDRRSARRDGLGRVFLFLTGSSF